jgi:hypothetical protein
MQRKVILLVVFLIIVAVSGVGCYTILTHPRVEGEEGDAIEHTGRYYREHCTDCHGDYHSYPYGFYYGYYPDYYWSNPRWGRYYAYPWWWDRYWWDDDGYYYDGEEVEPEGAEKAARRRGLPPPYVRPEVTSSQPFVVPDPTKDTGSTTADKEDKHVPKRIEQPETNKEEPKKEKPTRRRTD